jgi:hypothetical protein
MSAHYAIMRLPLHALRDERTIGLMKDHLVDDRPFAPKFDYKALQFGNAKASALLRRKAIGRLIVGLKDKLAERVLTKEDSKINVREERYANRVCLVR